MPTDIRPFLEKESALKALSEMIVDGKVGMDSMYLLEIYYQLIKDGKEIYKRLPQEVLGGLPEGGRRNVQASALLRAERTANADKQDEILPSGYTRAQEIVGTWAERDGCWHDTPEADLIKKGLHHNPNIDGSEARVYYNDGKYVYKTVDFSHYPSFDRFMDRISIHNAIFPETKMDVVGFGIRDDATDNRGYVAIIRQPFVQGDTIDDPALVHDAMKRRGFDLPSFAAAWIFVSDTGNLLIADIHDNNCVFTKQGNILVFDCEAHINDIPAFEGKYTIPDVEWSEQAVHQIKTFIQTVTPTEVRKESFLTRYATPYNGLREQLSDTGRYEGVIRTDDGAAVVQTHPQDEHLLLVSRPESIAAMLSIGNGQFSDEDRRRMSKGYSVFHDGKTLGFDLARGRVTACRQAKLRQSIGGVISQNHGKGLH